MSWKRLNRLVHRFAPVNLRKQWDASIVRSFADQLDGADSLLQKVNIATRKGVIRSNQNRTEILALLTEVNNLKPHVICEIGCDTGGTLALFKQCAAPDGLVLSVDIHHQPIESRGLHALATYPQRVVTVSGDSHDPMTFTQVERILNGLPIDFLFIDGDHSFSGVHQDLLMYSSLLRKGSLVAFHDIVEPNEIGDQGLEYPAYVGEVPEYFRCYVEPNFDCQRFIEDPNQSGYGIGLITWPDASSAKRSIDRIRREVECRETNLSKAA